MIMMINDGSLICNQTMLAQGRHTMWFRDLEDEFWNFRKKSVNDSDLNYAQDNKGSTTYQHDQPINDFAKPNAQFLFDRNQSMNDSDLTYTQDNNGSFSHQVRSDYAQTDIHFSPDSG